MLQSMFGSRPDCSALRHERNMGVAGAILTGIHAAKTVIVCSMDCDCTYDPHEFRNMIPLLQDGVDLVTASPYHSQGRTLNVPEWRLALSKSLSLLYRRVLRQKVSTYTSCFRVYRRAAVDELVIRHGGFLGITEMLGKLALQGSKIVEYPATLEVRMFGQSKMKVIKTIFGHVGLLVRLLAMRILNGSLSSKIPLRASLASSCQDSVNLLHQTYSERVKHE
jgi:glycosyltransferase involved in cell wall biosynthesis